jgi:hypothetical protein
MRQSFGNLGLLVQAVAWRLSPQQAADAEHVYLQESFVRRAVGLADLVSG